MIRYAIIHNHYKDEGVLEFLCCDQKYWSPNLKKVQKELKEIKEASYPEDYENSNYSIIKLTIEVIE